MADETINREQLAPLLTGEDGAAARLGTTPGHVRELRRQGQIGYVMVGKRIKYSESDLVEFIERHRVAAAS